MKALFCLLILSIAAFSSAEPVAFDFAGRLRPMESLERVVAFDFCGKGSCGGAGAEELVRKVRSGAADSLPVLLIRRGDVKEILHLPDDRKHFSRADLKDSRGLISQYAERTDSRPQTIEFVRLDRAISLYDSIKSESFWQKISVDRVSAEWNFRLQAERVYLQLDLSFWIWILSIISFAAIFLAAVFGQISLLRAGGIAEVSVSVLSFSLLAFRAAVEGQVPLLSLYELLLVLVFGLSLFGAFSALRLKMKTLALCGSGLAVLLLLFLRSSFETGDLFAPVSVLLDSSFWLSLHVFTIAAGFCLLLLSSVVAHLSLAFRAFGKAVPEKNSALLYATLVSGLSLSALGVLLGGFWADVAWGRFWGWDPKENAALIVVLWAALLLHLRAGRLVREKTWEALSALLAVFIAFCLLGINLLGVGLHSYGFSGGILWGFSGFVATDGIVIAALVFKKGPRRPSDEKG